MKMKTMVLAAGVAAMAGVAFGAKPAEPVPEEGKQPILRHVMRPREAISLCGDWEVAMVNSRKIAFTNEQGKADYRLEDVDLPVDAKWRVLEVPHRNLRGSGITADLLYWRKSFVLPKTFEKGSMAELFFEKIGESFELWVNGKKAFSHAATWGIPRRIDVSDFVQGGSNVIQVLTRLDGKRRQWCDDPVWEGSAEVGLTRPVHLEYSGRVHVKDIAYACTVMGGISFKARALIRNNADKAVTATVTAGAPRGIQYAKDSQEVELGPKSEKWVEFEGVEKNRRVNLWSPETPNLSTMDFRVAVDKRTVDARSLRFGFREVKAVGHRFYLNGHPFINRRLTWNGESGTQYRTKDYYRREFERFRSIGIYSFRVFGGDILRFAEAADECGMFFTPVAMTGGGAAWRTEKFWTVYEKQLVDMARAYRNYASILYWSVSNEFGSIYGGNEGGPREKPTTEHQVKAARLMVAEDPTRMWEACGEVELGYPIKGSEGPAPIRSYHYPIGCSDDGNELPGVAYWYANGQVPWQGIVTKTKPSSISEDLYHGTFDQFLGITKWAGDDIFTYEGFGHAAFSLVRKFSEGFYFSGIGTWEPWMIGAQEENDVTFNREGTPYPDFLISLLEFPQNLWAGEPVKRTVNAYNESFGMRPCRLWREDFTLEGGVPVAAGPVRDVSGRLGLKPGERYWTEDTITAPATMGGGAVYRVTYTLKDPEGTNVLATSTYDFRVFRRETVEAPCKFFESVDDLKGADRILVAKKLTDEEGLALEKWVRAGGRALMFEIPEGGWSPYEVEYRRGQTRVWRRAAEAFPGIPEEALRDWAPDGYLGHSGVPKMSENATFLLDAGRKEGLSAAIVFRLYRGKGCYLGCQMPVLDRLETEPCAPAFLRELYAEFMRDAKCPAGTVAIHDGCTPSTNRVVRTLFADFAFPVANDTGKADQLLVVDCSHGIDAKALSAVNKALGAGRTVWMLEVPADASYDALASFGLALAQPPTRQTPVPWRPQEIHDVDDGVRWVVRSKEHPGLLTGLSNDDLFWWNAGAVWGLFRSYDIGRLPMRAFNRGEWKDRNTMSAATAIIEPIPGASTKPIVCTTPSAWVELDFGGGHLVVSTLRFSANRASSRARVERTLRAALLNAGVRTANESKIHRHRTLDISKAMNRNLWHDPLTRKSDGTYEPEAWFGREDNDLRWFPVNLCGWSLAARNNCPREDFPTKPMMMGGVPFQLVDPLKNGNRGCLVLMTNETAEIDFDAPVRCTRINFLGAHSGDWEMKRCDLTVGFGDDRGEFVCKRGSEIGCCRWADTVTNGRCAFTFPTQQDATASVYRWAVPNPRPGEPVKKLTLRLDCDIGGAAVIALTAETDEM